MSQCSNASYTLTRTWTVTDGAGNTLVHTQTITVIDSQAPTAVCQNVTVTLDQLGQATITPAQVNSGSFDAGLVARASSIGSTSPRPK